ncbi:hypothetical protein NP569_23775, partial [Vibrio parahaemolyticus]|nr:hypothetical protein [Vibrio parahaemolyticus]
ALSGIPTQESKVREAMDETAVYPCPKHLHGDTGLENHRGKRWENGCPGVFFSTLAYQTPSLSRPPFYHEKKELPEGAK